MGDGTKIFARETASLPVVLRIRIPLPETFPVQVAKLFVSLQGTRKYSFAAFTPKQAEVRPSLAETACLCLGLIKSHNESHLRSSALQE